MELLIIFIILILVLYVFIFGNRAKNKRLYKSKIIDSEFWAKILYFEGQQPQMTTSSGKTHLKLSDGRSFVIWQSPFSSAVKFEQSDNKKIMDHTPVLLKLLAN